MELLFVYSIKMSKTESRYSKNEEFVGKYSEVRFFMSANNLNCIL